MNLPAGSLASSTCLLDVYPGGHSDESMDSRGGLRKSNHLTHTFIIFPMPVGRTGCDSDPASTFDTQSQLFVSMISWSSKDRHHDPITIC
eukprot:scaffold473_cov132-Cylindrotheca_fusiformis.AAC.7